MIMYDMTMSIETNMGVKFTIKKNSNVCYNLLYKNSNKIDSNNRADTFEVELHFFDKVYNANIIIKNCKKIISKAVHLDGVDNTHDNVEVGLALIDLMEKELLMITRTMIDLV